MTSDTRCEGTGVHEGDLLERELSRFSGIIRRLRCFRANRSGATAIEFGFIALPFLAILCAVFELGYANFKNELLGSAVETAARAMLTGSLQTANVTTSRQFISNYLCPANSFTSKNFNCSQMIVDVRPAATFLAGDTANDFYKSTSNEFCPGQPGQIIIVRVAYPLPAILPLNLFNRTAGVVSDVPNLSGKYHILMGFSLFQEENYSGSYTSPSGC